MFSDFNKMQEFNNNKMNPTKREFYEKMIQIETERRNHPPRFEIDTSEGQGNIQRYVSSDWNAFYGDCEDCEHYTPIGNDYDSGCGYCNLDNYLCGYGYTCENHRFTDSALYYVKNLENELKKEDGEPI